MMMILSPLPEVVKAAEKEKKDRMIAKKKAQAAALGKEPSEVELDEDDSDDDEVGFNSNSCHSHIPKVSFKLRISFIISRNVSMKLHLVNYLLTWDSCEMYASPVHR